MIWQKLICFVDLNLIETLLATVEKNSMLDLAGVLNLLLQSLV